MQNNNYTMKSLRAQSVTLCEDNCTRRQVKAKAKLKYKWLTEWVCDDSGDVNTKEMRKHENKRWKTVGDCENLWRKMLCAGWFCGGIEVEKMYKMLSWLDRI